MKIIMRIKYIYRSVVFVTFLIVFLSACKKFTELNPLASLSQGTAFSTKENIELARYGVYWQAAVGRYNPGTSLTTGRGYPFGGASIEQAEMRAEDMVNLQAFFSYTYEGGYSPSTANNVNHWEQLYALINQANVFIAGVQQAKTRNVVTEDEGNSYIGEALFLRALAHHELLLHFCKPFVDGDGKNLGVPYRTVAIVGTAEVEVGIKQTRGTVAETYAGILTDLDLAESYLPEKHGTRGYTISRATKGAVIALKTRIYLHKSDYVNVIAEGIKLGTGTSTDVFTSPIAGYIVENNVEVPFTVQDNNLESIFSIAQSAAQNGGVNGAITSMLGPSSFGARDLIATSPNLYNASFWLDEDLRKTKLQYRQSKGNYKLVFNYKYRNYGINDNWNPILRYTEVLLNVAEAYSFVGNDKQALSLLNAVRNRAVPESKQFQEPPIDLKLAIYQERRIEFTGEGKRWGDIHRLALTSYGTRGVPAKVDASQITPKGLDNYKPGVFIDPQWPAIIYDNSRFIWPIPTSERNANPNIVQNPGY